MKRVWVIPLCILIVMFSLWWRFGVLDYRGEYVWITYSVPPTEAEIKAMPQNMKPTTASFPIFWRTTTESVPETRVIDRGCDPRYQSCDQVFYMQGKAGRFERHYHQFAPWFGKHNPRQYGEKTWTLRPLWNLLFKGGPR